MFPRDHPKGSRAGTTGALNDPGEGAASHEAFIRRLAEASGVETPTRTERFRTLGRLLADVGLSDSFVIPIYQVIAGVSAAMHARGVRVSKIAKRFGVDHHTVDKALAWFRSR